MKIYSSKLVCKMLKINLTTLTDYIRQGAPCPMLEAYEGPNSIGTRRFKVRRWTDRHILALCEWAGDRVYARCSDKFRKLARKLAKQQAKQQVAPSLEIIATLPIDITPEAVFRNVTREAVIKFVIDEMKAQKVDPQYTDESAVTRVVAHSPISQAFIDKVTSLAMVKFAVGQNAIIH